MVPTRKTKAADIEASRQSRLRQTDLPPDDRIKEKLTDLRSFIRHLEKTDYGRADLQQRAAVLGACAPVRGESDRQFYGKLRHWLDQEV